MRCHYDVLRLTRDCSDDDIKKSYRKLALQWHPDKNADRAEECTREFHLIQQAYEVLIDPQERAWYDKHREAILKGGLGHGDKYEDSCLDVYQFFNASCYCGFGDDDKGFYAVYGEVFRKISLEDEEYMDVIVKAPEFGNSTSSYEEVGVFYAYWESYCTCKSYVWHEKFDTREAPNRQIRRLMEQDNKKLRDKVKRERNEEVRALVAYVRKRDKRVQAYKKKLEERAAEVARLAEEKKKNARLQRRKNLENYKESAWSSMSELEQQLKQLEMNVAQQFGEVDSIDDDDDDDDNDYDDERKCNDNDTAAAADADNYKEEVEDYILDDSLYCIACKKTFKSDKAMANHNRSKKHAENVSRLLLELGDDDADEADNRDDDNVDDDGKLSVDDVEVADDLPDLSQSRSKKKKKKRRQQQKMSSELTVSHSDSDHETDEAAAVADRCDNTDNIVTESDRLNTEEASSVSQRPATDAAAEAEETSSINTKLKNNKKKTDKSSQGKASAAGIQSADGADVADSLLCHKCRQTFTSRNKLFEHIKLTGHALRLQPEPPITQTSATSRDRKKSSKKK